VPVISSITTAVPTTDSDILGNMTTGGTTVTRRFSLADSLAAGFSAAGDLPYASSASSRSVLAIGSSEQILHVSAGLPAWKASSVFLSTILTAAGDVLIRSSAGITRLAGASSAGYFSYSTVDGAIGPVWRILDPGEFPVQTTAAGGTTSLQVPSSGAVLAYSTEDGSIGPKWTVMDAGELLVQTTAASPTTVLAVASSGGFLAFSTVDGSIGPVWRVGNVGTLFIGAGTTLAAGSSEQILHISGGVPAWKDSSVFLSTIMTAAGDLLIRSSAGIIRLAGASSAAYLAYSTVDGAIGPVWRTLDPGEFPIQTTAAGGTTSLQIPTEKSLLAFSTVDGAIGPIWIPLDNKEILTGTTVGTTSIPAFASSAGGKLVNISSVALGWIDDDWSFTFMFDGGGTTISASTLGVLRFPWDGKWDVMEMVTDQTGDVTIDVYKDDFSSTPASSDGSSATSAALAIADGQRTSRVAGTSELAGLQNITAGDYLTFDLISGTSGVTKVWFTMFGTKASTV